MLPVAWLTLTTTLGELLVAIGTGLLAAFTAWLGWEARASARAAKEAVEASEEPFVIATSTPGPDEMKLRPHEQPQQGQSPPIAIHRALEAADAAGPAAPGFVRLRLWNIGQGPAIVTSVRLDGEDTGPLLDAPYKQYPVGAGGAEDIEIQSRRWPEVESDGVLVIDYYRPSGVGYHTTSVARIGDPWVDCKSYVRERAD